jgi:hypothetical protein
MTHGSITALLVAFITIFLNAMDKSLLPYHPAGPTTLFYTPAFSEFSAA